MAGLYNYAMDGAKIIHIYIYSASLMMKSKQQQLTALRVVQLTQLVLYLVLLLQQLLEPHDHRYSKFQCAAQLAPPAANRVLPSDEVSALQTITRKLEWTKEETSTISCSDFVKCDCGNNTNECRVIGLRMSNIGLTGVIDEAVGNLRNLESLDLSDNKLHGSIPDSLGNLYKLRALDLSRNQLSGTIPESLGKLVSLRGLYLNYNLLSREIPSSFGSLLNLSKLYLHYNRLSGPIPDELGDLRSLTYLNIFENQLSGHLPATLGNLTYLQFLLVSSNYLNGEIPKYYGNLKYLHTFSISGNYMSGPLPVDTIANWTALNTLDLEGNNFEGNITQEIFDLPMLQNVWVSDLTNDFFQLPKKISNSAKFYYVTLRNCSITGSLPKYVGQEMASIEYLDLGFNQLTGVLPEYMKSSMNYMSFANNRLNGTIPNWIFRNVDTRMDLSFNNFSEVDHGVPSNLNLFACCRNSTTTAPDMMDPSDMKHTYCPRKKAEYYYSLFINCGGGETTVDGKKYDQDNETSLFYMSSKKNWAYSLTGGFDVNAPNASDYIKNITCGISGSEGSLYDKARISPRSIKYYAYCLRKGKYNVTLHFAEIVYTQDADYTGLRKCAFDVYIQGERKLTYFDIKDKAGGAEKQITRNFSGVDVNDSLLEIHLYWPGKGTTGASLNFHGPLISAISVTPEFKVEDDKLTSLHVAFITTASVFAAFLLLVAFAWWMGWLKPKKWPPIQIGLEKVDGDFKVKTVTLKELIFATGKFDVAKKLGEGTSGTVYKAKLQGHTVAVKKLNSSEFKTKMEELIKEIGTIKTLQHSSFLRLWDVYIGKHLQLFIYEYMENKSLADVLFERKNSKVFELTWAKRSKICLGIAKGLEYLHNHPRTKIFHSNIKTANILLDQDLQPKISDFGFANLYTSEDQLMAMTREASQGYMAPECFQKNVTLTSKADVYSFGVVILEIVCGKRNMLSNATQETEVLLDRAYKARQEGYLRTLVDSRLSTYDQKEAINILILAVLCTTLSPLVRPAMSDVVCVLLGQKTIDEVSPPPPKATFKVTGSGSATSAEFSLPSASSPSTEGPIDFESISADHPVKS